MGIYPAPIAEKRCFFLVKKNEQKPSIEVKYFTNWSDPDIFLWTGGTGGEIQGWAMA